MRASRSRTAGGYACVRSSMYTRTSRRAERVAHPRARHRAGDVRDRPPPAARRARPETDGLPVRGRRSRGQREGQRAGDGDRAARRRPFERTAFAGTAFAGAAPRGTAPQRCRGAGAPRPPPKRQRRNPARAARRPAARRAPEVRRDEIVAANPKRYASGSALAGATNDASRWSAAGAEATYSQPAGVAQQRCAARGNEPRAQRRGWIVALERTARRHERGQRRRERAGDRQVAPERGERSARQPAEPSGSLDDERERGGGEPACRIAPGA